MGLGVGELGAEGVVAGEGSMVGEGCCCGDGVGGCQLVRLGAGWEGVAGEAGLFWVSGRRMVSSQKDIFAGVLVVVVVIQQSVPGGHMLTGFIVAFSLPKRSDMVSSCSL